MTEHYRARATTSVHVAENQVEAVDLRTGDGTTDDDLVSLVLGDDKASVSVLGSLSHLQTVTEAMIAELRKVGFARQCAAEAAAGGCVDGGDHALSPVEDLGSDRQVMECIAGDASIVAEPDGTRTPVASS